MDHKEDIKKVWRKHPPEHSDYLHSIMMAWSHYMDYEIAWLGDSIVFMTELEGKKRLRPPIGPDAMDHLQEVIDLARSNDFEHELSMIGAKMSCQIEQRREDARFLKNRDYSEYVYLSSDLADLPGKKYLKVRNYLNKFRRENRYQVEPIDDGNIEEVKEFLRRWCIQKGCNEDPFLIMERQATMYSLENIKELDLSGSTIRIDDDIQALSIYEEMRQDMLVIHYEKANFDIQGLYQAINNEVALLNRSGYKYINRESDMGVPGLRKAKKKYGPDHMLEVGNLVI
jgi:hypothetical protein